MRRLFLLLLMIVVLTDVTLAQENKIQHVRNEKFAVKAQAFMGFYIGKGANLENINPSAPAGFNLGVEIPSSQQRPWQQYLNNPTVGFGLSYINFGADVMGHAVAAYPYIMFNAVRTRHFEMKVKLASGLGVVSRHYYSHEIDEDYYDSPVNNTIFSTYLNVYLATGLNMDFLITPNFKVNSELGFFHMSNGRTRVPNRGLNTLYGSLGFIAAVNSEKELQPVNFPDLPYKWSLNITGSVGKMHLNRADKHKFFMASFHTGATYSVNNWYAVGPGVDIFYSGGVSVNTHSGFYRKDLEYTTIDKMRVGVAVNNEFKFGVLTAILDWGIYVFNPSRNYFYEPHPVYGYNRPMFYKYKPGGDDDGWNYFRFGLRCLVWDNIYLQATAKTHLQVCEYIEFGIGYQIPFLGRNNRTAGRSIVFHHRKNWWRNY